MIEALRPSIGFNAFFPVYFLVALGIGAILFDSFLPNEKRRRGLAVIALSGLGMALLLSLLLVGGGTVAAFAKSASRPGGAVLVPMAAMDGLSRPGASVIILGLFLAMLLAVDFTRRRQIPLGEFAALTIFSGAGAVILGASRELLTLFLSLEVLSVPLYVLAASDRRSRRSAEAGFKYFVLGAFSSALMVLGIALVFGATGSTYFGDIEYMLTHGGPRSAGLLAAGAALILASFSFKLAVAPFHMYAPDVYDGAPAAVSALIAAVAKAGAFIALARFAAVLGAWGPGPYSRALEFALAALAAVSVVWGNAAGVMQRDIKRMLAYSSIAHSGYLLLGILAVLHASITGDTALAALADKALLVYLAAYVAMTLLAFGAASSVGLRGERAISNLDGLARTQPAAAAAMALAMVSLTGIPPTAGFWGKYLVFAVAIKAGYAPLAVLAVAASVASAYYYLGVVVAMYMRSPSGESALEPAPPASACALAIASAVVVAIGVIPGLIY